MIPAKTIGWFSHLNRMVPLLLGVALPFVGGCDIDELLEVPDPDVVNEGVFANPGNLDAVRSGVTREFARAYGGTQNDEGGQIHFSGLLTDEFYHSGTFTTRTEVDARNINETNASNTEAYLELQRARAHGELAAELFADSERAGSPDHAEILSLVGYTYNFFGENYCSGVPFSRQPLDPNEPVEYGSPETTEEIFARAETAYRSAEQMVDAAIGGLETQLADLQAAPEPDAAAIAAVQAQIAGVERVQHLVDVGLGRTLLNRGLYAEAAAQVSDVPTDFEWFVEYSSDVLDNNNAVTQLVNFETRWSAAGSSVEGNGVAFLESGDPRAPTTLTGVGFDTSVEHYAQLKYQTLDADIPLATGIEARLIEAEAEIQPGGTRATFFSLHNEARDHFNSVAGNQPLDELEDEGQDLVALHFEERAYWLWLTSHRLGDLRRMVRDYAYSPELVYPVGETVRGFDRGDHVNLRVPFDETNNPNYMSSACDPTEA